MSYDAYMLEDARLVMLRELHKQIDGRLNETVLTRRIEPFGYLRSRDWVRTQMRKLEELGAVILTEAGTVLIAEISRAGIDHVERRSVIEGIGRPSPGA